MTQIYLLLKKLYKNKMAYLFISPFFVLYAIFGLYPFLYALVLSFHRWNGLNRMEFIGLQNYLRLFSDPILWKTLCNTAYYWIGIVPTTIVLAMILAVLLNNKLLHFKGVFRVLYILPYVTCIVVVAIVFKALFQTNYGYINYILSKFGIGSIAWLTSNEWSKISVIFIILWKSIGFAMIVYLGGLQRISGELYEAAAIDGAGAIQQFCFITVPQLRNITLFLFVINTIAVFNIFGEPYLLTDGGPEYSSSTLMLFVYNNGFRYFKMGLASAASFILFALVLTVSLIQMKFLSEKELS